MIYIYTIVRELERLVPEHSISFQVWSFQCSCTRNANRMCYIKL